jgi:hypothetical protein
MGALRRVLGTGALDWVLRQASRGGRG